MELRAIKPLHMHSESNENHYIYMEHLEIPWKVRFSKYTHFHTSKAESKTILEHKKPQTKHPSSAYCYFWFYKFFFLINCSNLKFQVSGLPFRNLHF